jgi:hypothetical protein
MAPHRDVSTSVPGPARSSQEQPRIRPRPLRWPPTGGTVDRVVLLSNGEYNVDIIGVNWPHHVFVSADQRAGAPVRKWARA